MSCIVVAKGTLGEGLADQVQTVMLVEHRDGEDPVLRPEADIAKVNRQIVPPRRNCLV